MEFPKILRVATVTVDHIVEAHSDTNGGHYLSGFEGKFLVTAIAALGFNYQVEIPEDGEWGRLKPNGNWSGIIGMLIRGEADIGFHLLRLTEQRNQAVNFSKSYTSDAYTFITQKPGVITSVFAYLYPFDVAIWTGIFGSILLMTVISKILDMDSFCGGNFFKLCTSLLLQSLEMGDGTLKWRFFLGFWHFFTLVISCAYSAALLSFLTVPMHGATIDDLHQLSLAVQRGTHRCYIVKGTPQLNVLLNSSNEQYRILGQTIQLHQWYNSFSDVGTEKSINRYSAIIETRLVSNLFFGSRATRMLISKDVISVSPVAIALSKAFCCKTKLDVVLSRLSSAGLYDKLLRDESVKLAVKYTADAVEEELAKQLSIKEVSGCFLMLLLGWITSAVVFVVEVLYFYCFKEIREK